MSKKKIPGISDVPLLIVKKRLKKAKNNHYYRDSNIYTKNLFIKSQGKLVNKYTI